MTPQKGVALVTRLQPSDVLVELKWIQEIHEAPGPLGTLPRAVQSLIDDSDTLAVVEIQRVEASETPELGWIHRTVTATIREVLKGGRLPAPPAPVTLGVDGGELAIGAVTVRTDRYAVLRPGERYLVALVKDEKRNLWTLGRFWARSDSTGKIAALEQSNGVRAETSLQGTDFDAVVAEAKRRSRRRM